MAWTVDEQATRIGEAVGRIPSMLLESRSQTGIPRKIGLRRSPEGEP